MVWLSEFETWIFPVPRDKVTDCRFSHVDPRRGRNISGYASCWCDAAQFHVTRAFWSFCFAIESGKCNKDLHSGSHYFPSLRGETDRAVNGHTMRRRCDFFTATSVSFFSFPSLTYSRMVTIHILDRRHQVTVGPALLSAFPMLFLFRLSTTDLWLYQLRFI